MSDLTAAREVIADFIQDRGGTASLLDMEALAGSSGIDPYLLRQAYETAQIEVVWGE